MSGQTRVAGLEDGEAITAVLVSAYTKLMAPHYDPAVMAILLPVMTKANPALLESGTYYVHETSAGAIIACGGWTRQEPGTTHTEPGIGHIRHFGTHAEWSRQGLGAAIFARCKHTARVAGLRTLKCFSSLGAEAFYASLGFHTLEHTDIVIGGAGKLPMAVMVWTDTHYLRDAITPV